MSRHLGFGLVVTSEPATLLRVVEPASVLGPYDLVPSLGDVLNLLWSDNLAMANIEHLVGLRV